MDRTLKDPWQKMKKKGKKKVILYAKYEEQSKKKTK